MSLMFLADNLYSALLTLSRDMLIGIAAELLLRSLRDHVVILNYNNDAMCVLGKQKTNIKRAIIF